MTGRDDGHKWSCGRLVLDVSGHLPQDSECPLCRKASCAHDHTHIEAMATFFITLHRKLKLHDPCVTRKTKRVRRLFPACTRIAMPGWTHDTVGLICRPKYIVVVFRGILRHMTLKLHESFMTTIFSGFFRALILCIEPGSYLLTTPKQDPTLPWTMMVGLAAANAPSTGLLQA